MTTQQPYNTHDLNNLFPFNGCQREGRSQTDTKTVKQTQTNNRSFLEPIYTNTS